MRQKSRYFMVLAILCVASVAMLQHSSQIRPEPISGNQPPAQTAAFHAFDGLPLAFEANQGQTDSRVKFVSRGSGYTLFLTANEMVLSLRKGQSNPRLSSSPAVLRLEMVAPNPAAKVDGIDELPGRSNYFLGNDPKSWRANVTNYAKVRYSDVYPGIDLVYYGNQGKLEHDFVVSPGADPSIINLAVKGAEALRLDADGNLVAQFSSGNVLLHKPDVYQTRSASATRESVDGRFILTAENRIAFHVGDYDRNQSLVIDPVLAYSSFLGGTGDELGMSIAVDAAGNAYVTGSTPSIDFPTTSRALQPSFNGSPQCDDPQNPCTQPHARLFQEYSEG